MKAFITHVVSVRPFLNNLSVVKVEGSDNEVVANRTETGGFRWSVNEPVVYVPEGMIVPDDVMQERGYWNDEKSRGLLEGKKYNLVKMRRFGPEEDRLESRGLLFKIEDSHLLFNERGIMAEVFPVRRGERLTTDMGWENGPPPITMGSDVTEFLGLTVK
jgi:hypothetical protein